MENEELITQYESTTEHWIYYSLDEKPEKTRLAQCPRVGEFIYNQADPCKVLEIRHILLEYRHVVEIYLAPANCFKAIEKKLKIWRLLSLTR